MRRIAASAARAPSAHGERPPRGASSERAGRPARTATTVEPPEQGGLAFATADMLDEGAGDRDALAFSQAINDLGAKLASSADRDATIVSLEVLATKLEAALSLMADAVVRPRHEAKDWTRVQALWINALKNRAHEPSDVARVATSAAFYGDHPYAHPPEGTLTSAQHVQLADIASWKTPTSTPMSAAVEPYLVRPKGVRTFVVDRADAPQIVMSLASAGPRASDPAFPRLSMLNIGLGGSFTSRLNQNLREDHGWTYGARSRFNAQRGPAMFVVRADIRADAIAPALGETRKEIEREAKEGLTEAEVEKFKALLNGEALESFGTVHGAGASLAGNAALGLAPDQDAKDLVSQRSATAKDLSALAAKYLDLSSALVVLVGPKDLATKAFAENQLPAPELLDADGRPAGARLGSARKGPVSGAP